MGRHSRTSPEFVGTSVHALAQVLVVDDDQGAASELRAGLERHGLSVREVTSADDALVVLEDSSPDCVVIALSLSGSSGVELMREVNDRGSLPIIAVTDEHDVDDAVSCLEAGADDYLTMPLDPREFAARVRALVRRRMPPSVREDSALDVDLGEGTAYLDGQRVALTPVEQRVLRVLVDADGEPRTRQQLADQVWSDTELKDLRVVDVNISRLRHKLEADPSSPRHLRTVRGRGYRYAR